MINPDILIDVEHLSSVFSIEEQYQYYTKHLSDIGVVQTGIQNAMYLIRKSPPRTLTVVTGPEGISNWLGLPHWVRLYVWPDNYEVRERVSPFIQECLWLDVDKSKAKTWENKAPSTKEGSKYGALYTYIVSEASRWPELYDGGVETIDGFISTLSTPNDYVSMDFETDAQYKFKAFSTGLAIGSDTEQRFIGYYKYPDAEQAQRDAWHEIIRYRLPVFHSPYDMGVAKGKGWILPEIFEDTMLAAFSAGLKHRDDRGLIGLKALARRYLGREMRELSDFIKPTELSRHGTLNADPQALSAYAKEDARATLDLLPILKDMAPSNIYQLEKDLVPIVLDMEQVGFPLDPRPLETIVASAKAGMAGIERWLEEYTGFTGNMRSNVQLSELVYKQLGLKGSYGTSVGKEAMQELAWHPVCKRIRAWNKLDSLEGEADALLAQYVEGGYAYTNFNQTGASTGRFSSSDPINLQNKTDALRKAFVSEDKHMVVYRADYGQIELRIPAAWSGDRNMLAAISEGESLHKNLHKMMLQLGIKIEYKQVKTFDFALFYGADVPRVMEVCNCTREQAEAIIKAVEEWWVEAMAWRDTQIKSATDNMGWNYSMSGRPFYHPDLFSTDFQMYSHARRTAVNKPVQGTAADIMKTALLGVPALHKEYGGMMRLTVHDEIAGTVPLENWDRFRRDLRAVMLEAETRVPLEVEIGYGNNWKDAKPK
jgi:DNA polymerase I-like protein with 3'-5' exonuclease and polymerase domains